MSFCVNCGLEHTENAEHNFCARCGFALAKNTPPQQENSKNIDAVVRQSSCLPEKKPIAGIIVALVVGVFGLVWSGAVLFHNFYGTPSSVQVALLQTFPGLQIKTYLGLSFALMGYAILIIGALMAYLNHPTGAKVVRVTSYSMIAITIVLFAITYLFVTRAEAWPTLDAPTKGALIGGLVGGTIGAFLQWGLLLFLFHTQTKIKTKPIPPIIPKIPERPLTPIEKVANFLVAIPCAFISLLCAFAAIYAFFDEESKIPDMIGIFVSSGLFGFLFGWIAYKCFKALVRKS